MQVSNDIFKPHSVNIVHESWRMTLRLTGNFQVGRSGGRALHGAPLRPAAAEMEPRTVPPALLSSTALAENTINWCNANWRTQLNNIRFFLQKL